MKYYVYIENRMIAEVEGFDNAHLAYIKATEIADLVDETACLVDGNTGEIIAISNEYWDDEPADIDDDCGFDPYMGCFTDDC